MLSQLITTTKNQYYKLLLLVGLSGSGKTTILRQIAQKENYQYINLNYELSRRLLDIPDQERNRLFECEFEAIIDSSPKDTLLLDNIELIFAKEFDLNPLQLLKSQSRKKTIIVGWNGEYDGRILTFGRKGDDEYEEYNKNVLSDIGIVQMEELR